MVFHVTVGDTRILLRDLRDRNLDLAITRMDGTAMERDIESWRHSFTIDWPLSPDRQTPLTRRRKLTLHQLIDEPWALPPPANFLSRFIAEFVSRAWIGAATGDGDHSFHPACATAVSRRVALSQFFPAPFCAFPAIANG